MSNRFVRCVLTIVAVQFHWLVSLVLADEYDPPATYYNAATGTGSTLKNQLTSIMSAGHVLRSYGDFRESAALSDADPNNSGNILLVYNRASVSATWDAGATWNREHTWPDSRQPQSASNSSTGAIADPHMLRPANPSINSSRGNKPYGLDETTGSHGAVSGGYYFPGDADKGDMARTMFYAATRWSSSGLSLVEGMPSGFQMGDLSSLVNWHYLDAPDTFERRRNHVIYSQALNPSYFTNNRNAYVDHPEYVWSVFVNQMNDSQISIDGATVAADGSSTMNVDLGRMYVGGAQPASQLFTINKAGIDGTYFEVTTSGIAISSIGGRYNAFQNSANDSRIIEVGFNASTETAGLKTGTVIIDNLDVTTEGGLGHGANDGDDVFNVELAVLAHPVASFSLNVPVDEMTIDLGAIPVGQKTSTLRSFTNLAAGGIPDFVANLDLDSIAGIGDTNVLQTDLTPFIGLEQGDSASFEATFSPTSLGSFSAVYTLNLSDEDLPGEQFQTLTLTLIGQAILAGDFNTDGTVDAADYTVWRDGLGSIYTQGDYDSWRTHFGETAGQGAVSVVPEPPGIFLLILGATVCLYSRRASPRRRF